MIQRAVLSLALASVSMVALCSGAEAASLAAHRAIYDLSLMKLDNGATISGASGRLAYEITGSECEGWTVNFRILTSYDFRGEASRLFDSQSSSWEAGDGTSYNYTENESVDRSPQSSQRVSVKRTAADQIGKGLLHLPEEKPFEIPADAVFPSRYQLKLIETAEKGEMRDTSLVYDGSDNDKATRAIATIGHKIEATKQASATSETPPEELGKLKSWPVSVAYYNTGDNAEETPTYQVSFRMFENGASSDLVMDYGSFTLKGSLTKYEPLPQTPCK